MSKKIVKISREWSINRCIPVTSEQLEKADENDIDYFVRLGYEDTNGTVYVSNPIFDGDIQKNINAFLARGPKKVLPDIVHNAKYWENDISTYGYLGKRGYLCAFFHLILGAAKESGSSKVTINCYTGKNTSIKNNDFELDIPFWLAPIYRFAFPYHDHKKQQKNKMSLFFGGGIISLSTGIIGGLVTTGISLNLVINAGVQATNAAFQSGNAGVYVGLAILALGLTGFIALMCIRCDNRKKENTYLLSKKNTFLDHHSTEEKSKEYSTEDKLKADCSFSK